MRILLLMNIIFVIASAAQKLPPAWPDQFIATQMQYFPDEFNGIQASTWYYDYTNTRHRFDHTMIKETFPPYAKNSSEWWLDNYLYMYDFDHDTCIRLDMGMGPPMPDWFLTNSSIVGIEWQLRNDIFYKTTQLAKPAPYSPFNYYSSFDSGDAFRLIGPGPVGLIIVNDFLTLTAETPNANLFELPVDIRHFFIFEI